MKHFNIIIFIKSRKNLRLKRFKLKRGDKSFLLDNQQMSERKNQILWLCGCEWKNLKSLKKRLLIIISKYEWSFLDTETTGLSFKDGHKIVEIACIETNDLIQLEKFFIN